MSSERVKLPVITIQELDYEQQAYFILTLLQGSWIVNAMWEQLQEEEFCERIVKEYGENVEKLDEKSDLHEWINSDDNYWETFDGQAHYYRLALRQNTDHVLRHLNYQMLHLRLNKADYEEWLPVAQAIESRWDELEATVTTIPTDVLEALSLHKDDVEACLETTPPTSILVELTPCSCEMRTLMMSGCQCNGL